jgi:pimeloyl-ACP methyl ester carboxylesterase
MRRVLVFVHGLWLSGFEFTWLRRELRRWLPGESTVFKYPSVSSTVSDNSEALRQFLQGIAADELDIIAHSLGGLVVLKCFERELALPRGRVVLLGSPVRGSQAARGLARLPLGTRIMGAGVEESLLQTQERRWKGGRELGVIAGSLSFGLGKVVGQFSGQNDGTILVEETELPGAADRIVIEASHTGMLFSPQIARQIAAFLRGGRFER